MSMAHEQVQLLQRSLDHDAGQAHSALDEEAHLPQDIYSLIAHCSPARLMTEPEPELGPRRSTPSLDASDVQLQVGETLL